MKLTVENKLLMEYSLSIQCFLINSDLINMCNNQPEQTERQSYMHCMDGSTCKRIIQNL